MRTAVIGGNGVSGGLVNTLGRVLIMAEMHGRDLVRRHVAFALLVLLPLCFYLASVSAHDSRAVSAGGIGMAFAIAGAALFSILSATEVDQRLVLSGYRPVELLAGRLVFLGPASLVVAGGFTLLMALVSQPDRPWALFLGVAVVSLVAVAFGLVVGAGVPRELEGTLILIGVVGLQLAVRPTSTVAKLLPFYGPRRILDSSVEREGAVAGPLLQSALYGIAMLALARVLIAKRIHITRHPLIEEPPVAAEPTVLTESPGAVGSQLVEDPQVVDSGEIGDDPLADDPELTDDPPLVQGSELQEDRRLMEDSPPD
jgi:hypothetical protein